ADALGNEVLKLAEQGGATAGRLDWSLQRFAIAVARAEPASIGRLGPRLLAAWKDHGPMGSYAAWILGATGRREEGIQRLRAAAELPQGFFTLTFAAEACALLQDPEASALVDAQLRKRSGGTPFF